MNLIDAFVLFGTGYVCGLSLSSGFVLQGLKQLFAHVWNRKLEAFWMLASIGNALLCGLIAALLIAFVVIADQPERLDFWSRFALYVVGVAAGMGFVFVSAQLINSGVQAWKARRA